MVGGIGGGAESSLLYYDAITEILTHSELQAKLSGVQLMDTPGFGTGNNGWVILSG